MKDLLKKLISIESVSGNETEIVKFIKDYLEMLGWEPICVGENLVLKIEGANSDKTLIFNAHVDTVPAGDEKSWNHAPLVGEVVGNKIYGLGASDEKAAVAVLLGLAKQFKNAKPACDVWLAFVVKEELDGTGTREFVKWFKKSWMSRYKEAAVVLGEPTGLKKIELGHKGNVFLKVTTFGLSGHGSKPEKVKQHAVKKMYELATKMEALGEVWGKKYKNLLLGVPTVGVLTSIRAGNQNSPNKFPDTCVGTFDIRTVPEMHDKVMSEVKKIAGSSKVEFGYPPARCGYTPKTSAIARVVKNISGAGFGVSEGAADLCFFTQVGIPGVIFGPGEMEWMHKPNEYCLVSKLKQCEKLYLKVIQEFARGVEKHGQS